MVDANDPRPLRMREDRWPVAIHEAGHTVVALALGCAVEWMVMDPKPSRGVGGAMDTAPGTNRHPDYALVLLAGKAAMEIMVDHPLTVKDAGASSDMWNYSWRYGHRDQRADEVEVERILRDNWTAVQALAHALSTATPTFLPPSLQAVFAFNPSKRPAPMHRVTGAEIHAIWERVTGRAFNNYCWAPVEPPRQYYGIIVDEVIWPPAEPARCKEEHTVTHREAIEEVQKAVISVNTGHPVIILPDGPLHEALLHLLDEDGRRAARAHRDYGTLPRGYHGKDGWSTPVKH